MTNPPTPDEVAAREIMNIAQRSAYPEKRITEILQSARLDERRRCADIVNSECAQKNLATGRIDRLLVKVERLILDAPTDQSGGGG